MLLYCLSQLRVTHQDMHMHEMKTVTRKRCSLRYTYITNCSSITKMKLTATRDGWPTLNSQRKSVTLGHRLLGTRWSAPQITTVCVSNRTAPHGCSHGSYAAPNLTIKVNGCWHVIGSGRGSGSRLCWHQLSIVGNIWISIQSLVPQIAFRCHFLVAHPA